MYLFAPSFLWCQILTKMFELLFKKWQKTILGKIHLKTKKNPVGCVVLWAKSNSHFRFHISTFNTSTW